MRGNRVLALDDLGVERSIPAYAGEPSQPSAGLSCTTVYPRVCGGTGGGAAVGMAALGLSPRMRGNLQLIRHNHADVGSIPAYAGEPSSGGQYGNDRQVYPRVCGGTARTGPVSAQKVGLSPRMRGNHIGP